MADEKRLIPLQKRIIYAGDVFNSLMAEKGWSATEAADFIKEFRTVDVVEVVHGRWEHTHEGRYFKVTCTACGTVVLKANEGLGRPTVGWKYCSRCGAKMDGKSNVERKVPIQTDEIDFDYEAED